MTINLSTAVNASEPIRKLHGELLRLDNLDQFWKRIIAELEIHKVTSLSYAAIATLGEIVGGMKGVSLIGKSNHKQKCFEQFGLEQIIDNCNRAKRPAVRARPIIWHRQTDLKDAARRSPVGFTLPTTYFCEHHYGVINVSMARFSASEFDNLWHGKRAEIIQLLGLLDSFMRNKYLACIIGLSRREKQCLSCLAVGMRPREIAAELKIGEKTVEKYVCSARHKLKAKTRDQTIARAIIFKAIDL